ncbi:Epi-isozizaene 5-monooxygenase/(E)-beta-farnesene synthase [Acaryochloris thomasi RCC1774]|uniref:Epi-isozizaene 5-monooxygenase/(E)-beta-farnesene synthase n=1 Tax=Acaryochloris thomasi RCC1774 TaxID=1764569 RepID=A0A2W1JU63_9CYAN|nr:cytochrome P450 [Acaryochloris thomasi]PZD74555.1 Epi-isozizaene 5-monooxygenase/(E)-beta-farnesene synthase [Acaryochloris thomasi RCC1774]
MPSTLPAAIAPSGYPQRNHTKALRQDALGYIEYIAGQGDFLKIPFPLVPTYFVNHPDLIQEVMVKQSRSFHKPFGIKYTANQLFGDNLFTSDGELWKILRSTLQPGFSVPRLQNYAKTAIGYTRQIVDRWQPGETVEITDNMMELTLRTTTQCFFGMDLYSSKSGENLLRFIELFFKRISSVPTPAWVPIPSNRELKKLLKDRNDFFLPIIEERRTSGEDKGDILSMLVQGQKADTTGYITDMQVCNEVSNLFAAGYEVTAYSLAFTLYLLAQHPDIEARLRDEIARVLGTREITAEDLEQMPYLEQVLQESMRLLPVIAFVGRQSIEPVTIQGHHLPSRSMIVVAPWTLHRRADIYPEPLTFNPDRFADGNISKSAYLPFSGGPRACIGQGFAMMQMRINLAMILQRYRLSLPSDYVFKPIFNFNTRPQNGLPMVLKAV